MIAFRALPDARDEPLCAGRVRRNSARELFAEKGYTRTTIDEIAARVDYDTFATMVGALVAGFADQGRLDANAASPDIIALALTALWNGVQHPDRSPGVPGRINSGTHQLQQ